MKRIVSNVSNLQLLYEDNHLIAINKRIGDLVQGDKSKDPPLSEIVKDYLKLKYKKPGAVFLGVTHRLDRPTSGIVIFAKTSKALKRMNQLFQDKEIKKVYWAIVKKKPEKTQATLVHWLKKNSKTNTTKVYSKQIKGSKKAVLHYKTLKNLKTHSLLQLTLETGRSHQIRSQLAYIGTPIRGDLKYGYDRSNPNGGIHLHAKTLSFIHPVSKKMINIAVNPPKDPLWNDCLKIDDL